MDNYIHVFVCQITVYPKKYAHGFVVLCFVVVMQSFIMNAHEVFIHIHQGCFAGTGAIVRLPQCQWSKPDGYGKISQCITTTKHRKATPVCIFLGIYCTHEFSEFNGDLAKPPIKLGYLKLHPVINADFYFQLFLTFQAFKLCELKVYSKTYVITLLILFCKFVRVRSCELDFKRQSKHGLKVNMGAFVTWCNLYTFWYPKMNSRWHQWLCRKAFERSNIIRREVLIAWSMLSAIKFPTPKSRSCKQKRNGGCVSS